MMLTKQEVKTLIHYRNRHLNDEINDVYNHWASTLSRILNTQEVTEALFILKLETKLISDDILESM